MNQASEILGTIGAMQTLVENFPMSIFELLGNKVYNNPIEFILDVLQQLGISPEIIIDKLIQVCFGVTNAIDIYNGRMPFKYKKIKKPTEEQIAQAVYADAVPPSTAITQNDPNYIYVGEGEILTYYQKKAILPKAEESEFMQTLDKGVKGILLGVLSAILSCSIDPQIQDYLMDYDETENENNPNIPDEIENMLNELVPKTEKLLLPLSFINISHLLDICPITDLGNNMYADVEDLSVNTLYKSNDLDAFLWYVINRGSKASQIEINKMMWDSRLSSYENGFEGRNNAEAWNEWLFSKTESTLDNEFGLLVPSGSTLEEYEAFYDKGKMREAPLFPILQFLGTVKANGEKCLSVVFPNQTYYDKTKEDKKLKFNKLIYQFNWDYLQNIQLFNPRRIICEMLDNLLNGNIFGDLNINYSTDMRIFDAQLDQIIKNAIEADDITVSDCFFSFSNDDYDAALREMELERYSAKKLNSETSPAIRIDEGYGLDKMNEISSMATMNEQLETISKTVFDIAAIPCKDGSIEISDKLSVGYNNQWYLDVVFAICKPIVKAVLSPKVMLLLILNFQAMGVFDIMSIIKNPQAFLKMILDLLLKELIKIILLIIEYVKDKIIKILTDLFMKYIAPLIRDYGFKILLEKLEAWIDLILEAISCIPLFNFGKVMTTIDNVNYADIEEKQETPEGTIKC